MRLSNNSMSKPYGTNYPKILYINNLLKEVIINIQKYHKNL